MQRTQFHAKSAKNDLKPTNFLIRNFYFETEDGLMWLQERIPKGDVLERDWTTCSKYDINEGTYMTMNKIIK